VNAMLENIVTRLVPSSYLVKQKQSKKISQKNCKTKTDADHK
jgi:hypothetical protein